MSTDSKRTSELSCIVLAGGSGRRLGNADKGLLRAGELTLVEHLLACIESVVDEVIISANRNIERYAELGHPVVPDLPEFDHQGPLAGMLSCLPHCRHRHCLVCCVDMPMIPSQLVTELTHQAKDCDVAVCMLGGRRQPLFVMDQGLGEAIRQDLLQDRLGLFAWMSRLEVREVAAAADPPWLSNINTEAELAALEAALPSPPDTRPASPKA